MSVKPVRKAVFPVAGLGSRCLPATKVMPKEMLPVADKPLIQHVIEEARNAGIEDFIFITSPSKKMLEDHFAPAPELEKTLQERGKHELLKKAKEAQIPSGRLSSVYQNEPLGLGHAIWCARDLVGNEPFAVLLPDVIVQGESCLKQMIQVYNRTGGNVIAVEEIPRDQTDKYGIVDTGGAKGDVVPVTGLVEKPKPDKAPSTLSVIGRYILQPEVFTHLSAFEKGAGGEIQLTDAMGKLIGAQPFHAARFNGKTHDCGHFLGFIEANLAFGLANPAYEKRLLQIVNQFSA